MDSIVYGSINLKICVMPYIDKLKNPSKGESRNPIFFFLAQANDYESFSPHPIKAIKSKLLTDAVDNT